MYRRKAITDLAHDYLKAHVREGDVCVDATVGHGQDTALLCHLVGSTGRVYGFDIQKEALDHAARRLEGDGLLPRCQLILESHEHLHAHVKDPRCIVFNFGYLPGGDHGIHTRRESSLKALESARQLLLPGGFMTLCIYSGKDSGFEEKESILAWLRALSPREFTVVLTDFINRPRNPPLLAVVEKHP